MKTAAEYIETVYGTRTFARAVDVNDASSLMDLMQDFSDSNVKELFEMLQELVFQIENFTKGNIGEMEYFEVEIKKAKQLLKQATT